MSIVVTNNGEQPHRGRFNGVDYSFPVGVPVSMPESAAAHIFAYGKSDADRAKVLVKNGWQRNGTQFDPFGPDMAMKRLQSFAFQIVTDEDAVRASKPVKQIAPAQRERTGVNAMSKLADASGNTMPRGGAMQLPGSAAPLAPPAAQ